MAEEAGDVRVERHGGALLLTLSNPGRRNAFSPAMRTAAVEALRQAEADEEIGALIITGQGEHFCAGADVGGSAMDSAPGDPSALRAQMRDAQALAIALADTPLATVAAIEGDAFGAGLSIALGCDQLVTTPSARFGSGFGRLGLLPDLAILNRLPDRIGVGRARAMLLFEQRVTGEEAVACGLADWLAPTGGALARAAELAANSQVVAPLSRRFIKAALREGIPRFSEALDREADALPLLRASADFAEGVAAFRNKRPARFTGR